MRIAVAAMAVLVACGSSKSPDAPKPEERILFERLAGDQAETDRFLGVLAGVIPIGEYMTPSNLRKLIGLRGFAKIAFAKARARPAA